MTLIGSILRPVRPARAAAAPPRVDPPMARRTGGAVATSGTAHPNPDVWGDMARGWTGQSRVRTLPPVTPVIAQRHATVFACCNNIAGDHAKLPLQVRQRTRAGRDVLVSSHPADYLLNVEASPGVPAAVSRFALFYAFTLRGRAYAWAPRDGAGEIELIDVLSPDQVGELALGRSRFYDFTDGAGTSRRAPMRSMLHLRYMAEDGWTGRSPLQVAAESIGLALAGQEAAARAASGTHMRAVVKLGGGLEDEEAVRRNARRVRAMLEEQAEGGVAVIGVEEDLKTLDLSAADMELLAGRKFDREQILAAYRMPPSKAQIYEYGLKSSGQQQALDYKAECLTHWGSLAEAQMGMAIFSEAERRSGLYLAHDYDALLTATTKERYEAGRLAVGGPWMSWQEFRRQEGLEPLQDGEAPYPPPNMTDKSAGKGGKDAEDE